MARQRLPIAPHLSGDQISRLYSTCRAGVENTHWQILWLPTGSAGPPTPAEVTAQVGMTLAWVRTALKRWNARGSAGPTDRRAVANGGRPNLG
jgi:hypothetical protein